jgi:phosphomevalonate kinase
MRLSGPLKAQYAKDHGLDEKRLLDESEYKEMYRKQMIKWGEEMRCKDPGYFCRLAIEQVMNYQQFPVWLISDARRPTDLKYFQSKYHTLTVRIHASEETRRSRGWVYTEGVDDVESECALDGFSNWDFLVENDGNGKAFETHLTALISRINNIMFTKVESQL